MATINKRLLPGVKKLYYNDKLSVQDIADKLSVSINAVFYCMRKNNLLRRKKQESNLIKYERSRPSFKLAKIKSGKNKLLKAIGVMLYWGEGCKSDKTNVVDFANSDADMIVLFLKFLRQICGVDEKKLRVFPYFYSNQNIKDNINYWSEITGISKSQFTKPYIRNNFDERKKDKMIHGLVHIRYADKKLLNQIKNWIGDYKKI